MSIGDALRQAREAKGLSLESAAQVLHIRVKYLEALENDQPNLLPSPVQAKGFLRLYAAYLDLPLQPILDAWEGHGAIPASTLTPEATPAPLLTIQPAQAEISSDPSTQIEQTTQPEETAKPSTLSFQQIGQMLQQRRVALNLSLDEVERFTRVRQHYLKALEEGRLNDLPSTVQARGMLNNYAHFLNLDADELLASYAEVLQLRREENFVNPATAQSNAKGAASRQKTTPKTPTPNRWTRLFTPDLIIVGSVIIALLVFAVWSAGQVSSRQRDNTQVTPPSIAEVLLSASPPAQLPTRTPTPPPNIGTRQPQTAVSTLVGGSTLALTGTVSVKGSGALQLYVVARQRTYLRITADNRILFDERLVPGNAYAFAAERTLEVLISNAAGVQLIYGQTDLGNLGVVGEVKRILFTRDGMVTPTAAFSATPTRTPMPSFTPRASPTLPTATITPLIP